MVRLLQETCEAREVCHKGMRHGVMGEQAELQHASEARMRWHGMATLATLPGWAACMTLCSGPLPRQLDRELRWTW